MSHSQYHKGLVLIAVLLTISMLSVLLLGSMTELILFARSYIAYEQSMNASRQCEQVVHKLAASPGNVSPNVSERLLNVKPCAMVSAGDEKTGFRARFTLVSMNISSPAAGLCQATVVSLDKAEPCLMPSLKLTPGVTSWRWLPTQ